MWIVDDWLFWLLLGSTHNVCDTIEPGTAVPAILSAIITIINKITFGFGVAILCCCSKCYKRGKSFDVTCDGCAILSINAWVPSRALTVMTVIFSNTRYNCALYIVTICKAYHYQRIDYIITIRTSIIIISINEDDFSQWTYRRCTRNLPIRSCMCSDSDSYMHRWCSLENMLAQSSFKVIQ